MRPLRWKSRYLTGDAGLDARSRALVDALNETAADAKRVEHCQDFEDFSARIAEHAQGMLEQLRGAEAVVAVERCEYELGRVLETGLPLAARGTPACTDCCLCSLLEKRTRAWLGQPHTNRSQCGAHGSAGRR